MANIVTKLATLLNRIVDVVSQGNLQRVKIISEFNQVFKDAFYSSDIDRLCRVTTAPGNPKYKHELSSFYLRSGFKITIENDDNLNENDFSIISSYVIESEAFVRQLMAMGYDTLIIKGKNTIHGLQIPLKEIANLHNYMLE
jgi:hypothetical protein